MDKDRPTALDKITEIEEVVGFEKTPPTFTPVSILTDWMLAVLRKMCATVRLVVLSLFAWNMADLAPFESQDIVPVRINLRTNSRFWKRSEEEPKFVLSAFGKDMTLSLTPDTSFIAPSFTVQRVKAGDVDALRRANKVKPALDAVSQTEESDKHPLSCFYSGNVDNDQNSVVAVSLCSGIFGSFVTEGKEYFIEPKVGGDVGPRSNEQIHVLRRRILSRSPAVSYDQTTEKRLLEKHAEESFTHSHSDAQRDPRHRRFVSAPRFVETLVVADSTMTHFYGDEIKVRNH